MNATLSIGDKAKVMELFLSSYRDVSVCAKILISEEFSEDERKMMREQFGKKDFFETSILLDGLCCRQAREQVLGEIERRGRAHGNIKCQTGG